MAKVNQEVLKKHHFWIVAALAPLFALIAVLTVWLTASSAIKAGQSKIESQIKDVNAKNPVGKAVLKELDEQKVVVSAKQDKLWEYNWNDQKSIFTWPKDRSGILSKFLLEPKDPKFVTEPEKAMMLKFGAKLPDDNFQLTTFTSKDVYEKSYEDLSKELSPTQFNGPWQGILKYVTNWTEKKPESWVVWLAIEDMWIQRGVIEPIKVVTNSNSAFTPADATPSLKRSFVSKLWKVDLEMKTAEDGTRSIQGKIKNITDRVQLFGIGNTMKLNLYFDNLNIPFDFRIEGEFLESGKEIAIPYVPLLHNLSADQNPQGFVKIEQVFDAKTVPVKRLDLITIGKTSNRHVAATLKKPTFVPETETAAAAGDGTGEGGAGPGAPTGRGGPGGPGGFGGPGGPGGFGGAAVSLDLVNKLRYLEITEQVRRVPVAIIMVVDSMYIQDVLSAYSNSKLRFQVAQVSYKRFRDKLSLPSSSSAGGNGDNGSGQAFGLGEDEGSGVGGSRGPSGPGGIGGLAGPGGLGGAGPGGFGYGGSGGYGGYGGLATQSSGVSDNQAGLVELTIYGVVSLYDRFGSVPETASGDQAASPMNAMPMETAPANAAPANANTPPATVPANGNAPTGNTPPAGNPPAAPDAPAVPPPATPPANEQPKK